MVESRNHATLPATLQPCLQPYLQPYLQPSLQPCLLHVACNPACCLLPATLQTLPATLPATCSLACPVRTSANLAPVLVRGLCWGCEVVLVFEVSGWSHTTQQTHELFKYSRLALIQIDSL